MAQTLLKEIDYIFDDKGEVQYIQVDVNSTDQPQSAYANAHVRIVQDDLTGKQTFDNLNKNVIAGLALKKARDYLANITDMATTADTADTADTAGTADTAK